MDPKYQKQLIFISVCIALNIGLGKVSNLLSLPFTMDTIGTILSAALLPWPLVITVGALSSIIASMVIHPAFLFYIGTQIVIGLVASILVKSQLFKTIPKSIISGLIIGIASAVVSAPVTAIVFGGVSVPGLTALNVLFLASGKSLWTSVISGSLIVESIDKVAASIVSCLAIKRLSGNNQ